MFEFKAVEASTRVTKYALLEDSKPVSFRETIELWKSNPEFTQQFIDVLAAHPADAARWETPYVTEANVDRPFEFVLVDAPELDRRVDTVSFADKFDGAASSSVIAFSNLGGTSMMVVPTPGEDESIYCHLLSFLRGASDAQRLRLWQVVAEEMTKRISAKPVWLSTAGGGVAWLHVRLDNRPKYYTYGPYSTENT